VEPVKEKVAILLAAMEDVVVSLFNAFKCIYFQPKPLIHNTLLSVFYRVETEVMSTNYSSALEQAKNDFRPRRHL
jgi:hypothetical protein